MVLEIHRVILRLKDTLEMFYDNLAEHNRVTNYPESSWDTIKLVSEMLGVLKKTTTSLLSFVILQVV